MPDALSPEPNTDITDAELQAIHDLVDAEIKRRGCPTDDELHQEVERLNRSSRK